MRGLPKDGREVGKLKTKRSNSSITGERKHQTVRNADAVGPSWTPENAKSIERTPARSLFKKAENQAYVLARESENFEHSRHRRREKRKEEYAPFSTPNPDPTNDDEIVDRA